MSEIKIISTPIPLSEIKSIAENQFGFLVKAVVDIQKKIMAIGGELHTDEEALLIQNGSEQKQLWGINIYPEQQANDMIEFDSMINLRPYLGNRSRSVDDVEIQNQIIEIVNNLLIK